MAVLEIAIEPVSSSSHMSDLIARAVQVLKDAGVDYQITPMGTILQGEISDVLDLAKRMHCAVQTESVSRVITTIRIDDSRGAGHALDQRVQAVEKKLSEEGPDIEATATTEAI